MFLPSIAIAIIMGIKLKIPILKSSYILPHYFCYYRRRNLYDSRKQMTGTKAQVVYVDQSGRKFNLDSKAKLKWACRRGMLELDVLFGPFVDDAYDALNEQQKFVFQKLLACEDPELFAWFMGHETCPDQELAEMVALILGRVKV